MTTTADFEGTVFWTVTFEATEQQNGDYEFLSEDNPDYLRGVITAHPQVPPPPPARLHPARHHLRRPLGRRRHLLRRLWASRT